jgi:hypothetical protein
VGATRERFKREKHAREGRCEEELRIVGQGSLWATSSWVARRVLVILSGMISTALGTQAEGFASHTRAASCPITRVPKSGAGYPRSPDVGALARPVAQGSNDWRGSAGRICRRIDTAWLVLYT